MGCGASQEGDKKNVKEDKPQEEKPAEKEEKKPASGEEEKPKEKPKAEGEKPKEDKKKKEAGEASSSGAAAASSSGAHQQEAEGEEDPGEERDLEEDYTDLAGEFRLGEIGERKQSKPEPPAEDGGLDIGVEEAEEGEFKAVKPWVGAIAPPTGYEKPADQDEAPADSLQLEHVYGVRSRDVHDTVYSAHGGSIVYCTAAVNVVQSPDGKQRFFMEHTDDILCLAVHRESGKAASGQVGKNPSAWVWDVASQRPVCELAGAHERGIVCIDFSPDGSQVVTVGLDNDHTVVVWDANTGARIASSKSGPERILEAKFLPDGTFVTVGKRLFQLWTLSGGSLAFQKGIFGSTGPRQTMTAVAAAGGQILTGALDGSVYVWSGNRLKSVVPNLHKGPVYSLRNVGGHILSGGKDGIFKVLDERLKEQQSFDLNTLLHSAADVNSVKSTDLCEDGSFLACTVTSQVVKISSSGQMEVLVEAHHGVRSLEDGYGELWGLSAVSGKDDTFVTACDDGTVRRWNVNTHKAEVFPVGSNPRSVDVSPDGSAVAVGFLDGFVRVYNAADMSLKFEERAHGREVGVIKYSPDGSILASGAHDSKIVFFDAAGDYSQVGMMNKHSSYITHLDFSKDGKVVQSNCGAEEILFTKVGSFEQDPNSLDYKDTEWASYTLVLGWPVQGIWPKFADVTDVNAADRSNSGNLIVTGEDSGLVQLFKFPCLGVASRGHLTSRPDKKSAKGHSEHVTNVKFLPGDGHVISVGGADLSVFQWKHIS